MGVRRRAADGSYSRVGGGPLDPATGHWGQGSYDSDDVSRAAVVYLRHWQQTGSRDEPAEGLRAAAVDAYFQTTTGPDAGNVVLWMQADGRSTRAPAGRAPGPLATAADSYWLARSLWAFGEGYAAFQK